MSKKQKTVKKGALKFSDYRSTLDGTNQAKLDAFFRSLDERLYLPGHDRKLLKNDFQRAFVYYFEHNVPFYKAIERLDLSNLGGFYSRESDLWIPLDDVAKSYTQFADRSSMSVFRLAAYVKDRVSPELLQIALDFTIKRFPYFAMSIKRGFFWHYLDSINGRFAIEKEGPLPVQRIHLSVSGSKAFRVMFYENRISVEFFHGMSDGTGGKEFLKTLLLVYLRLNGKDIKESPLVIEPNSLIDNEEYKNEFKSLKRKSGAAGYLNKKALQLSGNLTIEKPSRVYHFKMATSELKAAAKRYGVNVTSYVASLLFFASKASIDELKGDVSITLPVNMRNHFPSKTLRNFSLFTSLREEINEIKDFPEFAKRIYAQLKEKTEKDKMLDMMAATGNMFSKMKFIPLPLKQPVTKMLGKMLGDRIFTTALSNLGVVELPEDLAKEVLSMDFVLGTTAINRTQNALITVNGVTTLSISKYTKDPSFEEKLYALLKDDGIAITVEGSQAYGR
ncbi:MAG: hypothetical protein J6328_07440 [Bacilli bacterium]|nr:hypothetical protein [Bacilli bacterium]